MGNRKDIHTTLSDSTVYTIKKLIESGVCKNMGEAIDVMAKEYNRKTIHIADDIVTKAAYIVLTERYKTYKET